MTLDDEDAVRRVGARMIQRAGYSALTASNGREAVELFDKHVDQIVCVLLDLSMPEMDGEQTLCELRRIRKDLPIILSSGLSQEEISDRFENTRIASFLPKPFRYQQLTEQLNHATST